MYDKHDKLTLDDILKIASQFQQTGYYSNGTWTNTDVPSSVLNAIENLLTAADAMNPHILDITDTAVTWNGHTFSIMTDLLSPELRDAVRDKIDIRLRNPITGNSIVASFGHTVQGLNGVDYRYDTKINDTIVPVVFINP